MTGTDDLKIAAKKAEGKVKSAAGHVTRKEDLEIDGQIDQASATARKNGEDESDLFGDAGTVS